MKKKELDAFVAALKASHMPLLAAEVRDLYTLAYALKEALAEVEFIASNDDQLYQNSATWQAIVRVTPTLVDAQEKL